MLVTIINGAFYGDRNNDVDHWNTEVWHWETVSGCYCLQLPSDLSLGQLPACVLIKPRVPREAKPFRFGVVP